MIIITIRISICLLVVHSKPRVTGPHSRFLEKGDFHKITNHLLLFLCSYRVQKAWLKKHLNESRKRLQETIYTMKFIVKPSQRHLILNAWPFYQKRIQPLLACSLPYYSFFSELKPFYIRSELSCKLKTRAR